jgi:hypothetical protein
MKKLIKSSLFLLWLKIKNSTRVIVKKPMVVKRGGKTFVNVQQVMKNSNRHQRRAMKTWAKRNPDKIINV